MMRLKYQQDVLGAGFVNPAGGLYKARPQPLLQQLAELFGLKAAMAVSEADLATLNAIPAYSNLSPCVL
jgi:hypothetical protein